MVVYILIPLDRHRSPAAPQQTFDADAQRALIDVLRSNTTLTNLRFLGMFENYGAVADALISNRTLQAVDLSHYNGSSRQHYYFVPLTAGF